MAVTVDIEPMARMTKGRRDILNVLQRSGPLTRVMIAAELDTDHLLLAKKWRSLLDLGWIQVEFERQETKHGPASQFLQITDAGRQALTDSEVTPVRVDLDVQNRTAQRVLNEGATVLGYRPEQLLGLRRNQLAEMQARNVLLRFAYDLGATYVVLADVFGFDSHQTAKRGIVKTQKLLDAQDSETSALNAKIVELGITS